MNAFEKMLAQLAAQPGSISNRLTAQTAFVLNLMLFACTKEHRKPDGSSTRLMAFAPGSSGERELSFAVRRSATPEDLGRGARRRDRRPPSNRSTSFIDARRYILSGRDVAMGDSTRLSCGIGRFRT
jgi:hypothetical protein